MAAHARTARARSTRPGHGAETRTWTRLGSDMCSIEIIVLRNAVVKSSLDTIRDDNYFLLSPIPDQT